MKKAFTLIELLIVILIIAIMLSILIPALSKARDIAKGITCLTGLKQIAISTTLYVNEHKDYPDAFGVQSLVPGTNLPDKLASYLDAPLPVPNKKITPWVCPFDNDMYKVAGGSYMYTPFYYRLTFVPSMPVIYDNVPLLPMVRDYVSRKGKIHIVRSDSSCDEVYEETYAPGSDWLDQNRR